MVNRISYALVTSLVNNVASEPSQEPSERGVSIFCVGPNVHTFGYLTSRTYPITWGTVYFGGIEIIMCT